MRAREHESTRARAAKSTKLAVSRALVLSCSRALLILAIIVPTASGCDWFDNPSPEEARLIVQGDTGKAVRLIMSTKFVAAVNERGQTQVVMFESDTLVTRLPFETVYDIEEDQRFFVEASRLDVDLQSVSVQVFVDRNRKFNEGGLLIPDHPYRFVYLFNQAVTREIVVI